jgi:hypothetical protein
MAFQVLASSVILTNSCMNKRQHTARSVTVVFVHNTSKFGVTLLNLWHLKCLIVWVHICWQLFVWQFFLKDAMYIHISHAHLAVFCETSELPGVAVWCVRNSSRLSPFFYHHLVHEKPVLARTLPQVPFVFSLVLLFCSFSDAAVYSWMVCLGSMYTYVT